MKQNITVEQLNELSFQARKKLNEYGSKGLNEIKPVGLLNIGDMIEFLEEEIMGDLDLEILINGAGYSVWTGNGQYRRTNHGSSTDVDRPELVDALWQAVKEVLERD